MNKSDFIHNRVTDSMYDDDTLSFCDAHDKAMRAFERFLNEETFLVNSFIEEDLDEQ